MLTLCDEMRISPRGIEAPYIVLPWRDHGCQTPLLQSLFSKVECIAICLGMMMIEIHPREKSRVDYVGPVDSDGPGCRKKHWPIGVTPWLRAEEIISRGVFSLVRLPRAFLDIAVITCATEPKLAKRTWWNKKLTDRLQIIPEHALPSTMSCVTCGEMSAKFEQVDKRYVR